MKSTLKRLLPALVVLASLAGPQAHADWAQSTDPLIIAARPTNLQIQAQNPPTYTWARYPTTVTGYTLEIRSSAGAVVATYTTDRNWYLPSATLPVGSYSWRVRPTNNTDWSTARQFVVDSTARPFIVPENAALKAQVLSRPRPRGLSTSIPVYSQWSAAMKSDRANALLGMSNEVLAQATKVAYPLDSMWIVPYSNPATAAFAAQISSVQSLINLNARQLEAASLLYYINGDPRFLTEAISRGLQRFRIRDGEKSVVFLVEVDALAL